MNTYDICEWLKRMESYFTHEIPNFELEHFWKRLHEREVTGRQLVRTLQVPANTVMSGNRRSDTSDSSESQFLFCGKCKNTILDNDFLGNVEALGDKFCHVACHGLRETSHASSSDRPWSAQYVSEASQYGRGAIGSCPVQLFSFSLLFFLIFLPLCAFPLP